MVGGGGSSAFVVVFPTPKTTRSVLTDAISSFPAVPVMTIFEADSRAETPICPSVDLTKANGVLRLTLNKPLMISGDVRLTMKNKPNAMMLKEKMFHFWFNTFFVNERARCSLYPLPVRY